MCKCDPNIRTQFCGKVGCQWPNQAEEGAQVSHPSHYNQGRVEVIDFIRDQNLEFNLGNTVKYICRAGKKNPEKHIEDLEKARFYLSHEIETLRAERDGRVPPVANDLPPPPKVSER